MSCASLIGRRFRRANRQSLPRRFAAEALESRRMFAAVSWDGGGNGTSWTDALNWSNNALPGAGDDVTISIGANPSISLSSGCT